jgi:ABC-type transporter Mla maintaining outer membrane lipid asymmetry permease subunit MlaE
MHKALETVRCLSRWSFVKGALLSVIITIIDTYTGMSRMERLQRRQS